MNRIHLISHAMGNKPETEVNGDCVGIRMREPHELVHYREDEDNTTCPKCGGKATVWLGSEDRWSNHSMRCN